MGVSRREFQKGALGVVAAGSIDRIAGGSAMAEEMTGLQVPAFTLPVPSSISPQAQAFLSAAARRIAAGPPSGDRDGDRVR